MDLSYKGRGSQQSSDQSHDNIARSFRDATPIRLNATGCRLNRPKSHNKYREKTESAPTGVILPSARCTTFSHFPLAQRQSQLPFQGNKALWRPLPSADHAVTKLICWIGIDRKSTLFSYAPYHLRSLPRRTPHRPHHCIRPRPRT